MKQKTNPYKIITIILIFLVIGLAFIYGYQRRQQYRITPGISIDKEVLNDLIRMLDTPISFNICNMETGECASISLVGGNEDAR